jgi:hypothetical protein
MTRAIGTVALGVLGVWLIAHVLWIGPVESAAETTVMWILGIAAASVALGGTALLLVGLVLGRTQPAWLSYVRFARTGAIVLGCLLIVVGLLHYRNTEPRGEIHWVVVGLVVLVGAAAVHWWLARRAREA